MLLIGGYIKNAIHLMEYFSAIKEFIATQVDLRVLC